jgi:hypothetical protein
MHTLTIINVMKKCGRTLEREMVLFEICMSSIILYSLSASKDQSENKNGSHEKKLQFKLNF